MGDAPWKVRQYCYFWLASEVIPAGRITESKLPIYYPPNSITVSDYIYARESSKLHLLSKTSGLSTVVADTTWLANTTGITTDGQRLYAADDTTGAATIRILTAP
ncbi:hypothetical protein Dvina_19300 [Dactylosporangium vinaceum]|uniref:Uncharacterized protein n=1 Tax=Dactylosporangium vinaceum TaxID=53362 RepID=A0ABV5M9F3_9ACTN|nr:hypothetical protein [Dactylosporangium vinaceum]UAC00011.1 hypothetical protein Dvina_19300 [Dactylosporangium vinaceum]